MIKKKLFKYGSVFMCAALMACSLAACGTNSVRTESATAVSAAAANDNDSILSNALSNTLYSASQTTSKNVSTEKKRIERNKILSLFVFFV